MDNNWGIQGIGDFNGDGKADIVWRQADTGAVVLADERRGLRIRCRELGYAR